MILVLCLLILLNVIASQSVLSEKCQQMIYSRMGIKFPVQNYSSFNQNTTLENIQQLLRNDCLIRITPHYKWAQNTTHVQVKIQFKGYAGSTPCQHVLYANKSLNYDNFHFQMLCIYQRTYLIDYYLEIKTYKSMNYHFHQWIIHGNYATLQVLKSPSPYIWKILHSHQIVPERKPKIWWEILTKYEQNMKQYVDLMDIGQDDREISAILRKRSNFHKKKTKNSCQNHEDIQFYCYQGDPQYLGSWL